VFVILGGEPAGRGTGGGGAASMDVPSGSQRAQRPAVQQGSMPHETKQVSGKGRGGVQRQRQLAAMQRPGVFVFIGGEGSGLPLIRQSGSMPAAPQQVFVVCVCGGVLYIWGENVTRRHIRHTSMALPTGIYTLSGEGATRW
jgi:hypothetical protein